MKPIRVLYFLLTLLVPEATCSIPFRLKLAEIQQKVHDMAAAGPSTLPDSNAKKNGRVFYPIGYGADPTGAQDSSDAILMALGDAFQLQNELVLLPGVNDLGGVVIDMQGGNYKISKPIRFPAQVIEDGIFLIDLPGSVSTIASSFTLTTNCNPSPKGPEAFSSSCFWTPLTLSDKGENRLFPGTGIDLVALVIPVTDVVYLLGGKQE
ncbi:hypothetical protein HHK36_032782 [Tetracentron sinense]|uniref:Pectate lyase superfamily protein domain-containing protein n=1 Tax=Tetracentron sinense TaxID=13715 RepID=A0A835CX96_TETSI|nr:hypothetical protein HHK36_032782 [Tetracentron sinense]